MKQSQFTSYNELPLFLNTETVARALGVNAGKRNYTCRAAVRRMIRSWLQNER